MYTSKLHYHMVQLTASTKTKACWVDCKMKCVHFSNIVSHLHKCLHCSIYLTVLLGQSWREGQNQETLLHLSAMAAHTWWQIHCTLCNNRTCAQLHHPGPCTSWWSLQHQSLVNAMFKVIHAMKCKLTPSTAFPHRMEITWLLLHDTQCQCTSYCNLVSIPATPVRWTSTNHNFAVPSEANSTFVVGVHKVISTGNWLTVKCISLGTMSSSNTLLTTTLSFFIPFATISLSTFTTHGSHTQLQTPNQLSAASQNCLV